MALCRHCTITVEVYQLSEKLFQFFGNIFLRTNSKKSPLSPSHRYSEIWGPCQLLRSRLVFNCYCSDYNLVFFRKIVRQSVDSRQLQQYRKVEHRVCARGLVEIKGCDNKKSEELRNY